MPHISLTALVVRDYDEAIDFYVNKLGFDLREDTRQDEKKRWVVVAPKGSKESGLLLAKAATESQASAIGSQTAGRVGWFLQVEDFEKEHARMRETGVVFEAEPRLEKYGMVAVFQDLYGNRWDLLGPPAATNQESLLQ